MGIQDHRQPPPCPVEPTAADSRPSPHHRTENGALSSVRGGARSLVRRHGQTVEALAAKTDVKARAQEKAVEVKEQAAAKAGELKEQATVKAGELKAKAADLAHQAQDRLPDPVKDKAAQTAAQARAKAAQAGQLWQEKAPEPVRQKTAQGAQLARDNRKVLLAAAGVAVVLWLACRRRKG
ncbi:hypothetical protein WJ438_01340 [Streptomyces sp. GD-15H]|uniref:hypothetical protein n=1 Tax=Streptomyces sp. GD-15H TaxID=3129112 RepID=UPI003246A475